MPLKPSVSENFNKTEQTNSNLAYEHYVNRFELGGFNTAKYLDPESRRVAQGTLSFANTLTRNLVQENKIEMAKAVMKKTLSAIPLQNSSLSDTLNKVALIQNLYLLGNLNHANKLTTATASFIEKEFDYILSLKTEQQKTLINDVQIGFFVLQNLDRFTENNHQKELNKVIKNKLKNYDTLFIKSLG